MARPSNFFPIVYLTTQMMPVAPTKSLYSQTVRTMPLSPRVVPTSAPTIQPTACSSRVDPTPQAPSCTPPHNQLPALQGWLCPPSRPPIPFPTTLAPVHLYHPRIMNSYPAKISQDKVLTTWPMTSSLPLLPLVANYQPISSPSVPFLSTNLSQWKLLSISNYAATLGLVKTRTNFTQTNWGVSTRALSKTPTAHTKVSKAPTPSK